MKKPTVNILIWIAIAIVSGWLVIGKAHGNLDFSWWEIVGFITGLVSVYLVVIEHHWTWPIGNVNSFAFLVLFWQASIYANSLLQVVYIAQGFFGWYQWNWGRDDPDHQRRIRWATVWEWWASVAAVILLTAVLLPALRWANGAATFWDASTTALSLVAMVLMAYKIVENWIFWLTADLVYIFLFPSQGLWLTGALYVLFALLCMRGLWVWIPQAEPDHTSWLQLFHKSGQGVSS